MFSENYFWDSTKIEKAVVAYAQKSKFLHDRPNFFPKKYCSIESFYHFKVAHFILRFIKFSEQI